MKLDELPFDFVRRRVSVSVEDVRHGDKSLICKGAVEEMLMVVRICAKATAWLRWMKPAAICC